MDAVGDEDDEGDSNVKKEGRELGLFPEIHGE